MFYAKLIILLCVARSSLLKFTVTSDLGKGTHRQICLSSSTDTDYFLNIGEREMSAIGITKGECYHEGIMKEACSVDVMSNFIVQVHNSIFPTSAYINDKDKQMRVEFHNDRITDSLAPGIHNCSQLERKPLWTEFIPEVNKTAKVEAKPVLTSILPDPRHDFEQKMKQMELEVSRMQQTLNEERAKTGRIEDESRTRMRALEDKLRNEWAKERSERMKTEEELRNERQQKTDLERRMHAMNKDLRKMESVKPRVIEEEKEKGKEADSQRVGRGSSGVATTMATVVITSLLASSVAALTELKNRDTNHILNRPGNGVYMVSNHSLTQNECTLSYGQKCLSWEMQVDANNYPFFVSNVDKYSLMEAITETIPILIKNNENCELSTSPGSPKSCAKEASTIKKFCTDDVRAYFFLNSMGKLSIVACPDNNILSEDCNFCISKQRNSNQNMFMPIQDAFCQKSASDIAPTIRYSKDICTIGVQKVKQCHKATSRYERMAFIAVGAKKIYIEELKMRSTQEYDSDQFLCYKIKAGSTVKYEKVQPSKCKGVDTAGTQKCNGDEYFCNRYPCETSNPEAHCMLRKHAASVEVNIGGVWIKPRCIGYERVLVKRVSIKSENLSTKECTTCLWECSKGRIVLKTHGPQITYATACSHGSCKSVTQDPSTFVYIPYPGNSEIIGGDIGIHMTEDGSPSNIHTKVHCEPKDSCEVSDCLFCTHGLLNYQCHSLASALIISTAIAAVLIVSTKLLLRSKQVLPYVTNVAMVPLKWLSLALVWVLKAWKKRMARTLQTTNNAIGWNQNDVERGRNINRQAQPAARYAFYGVTVLSLITPGLCCSESVLAESNIMQCTTTGSSTSCKASGTVMLKLGPIGSESCLILKGLRENEKQFISIKTVSSELNCREGESFWTSLYTPVCLSSRRCHLMGECTADVCLKWKNNKTSAEFTGKTHNDVLHDNRCFEQSGGMGYGCFNVNPSCLMVHSYLKPVYKNAFKVFKCVSWNHRIKLLVTTHTRKFEITLMAMSTQQTDWGSIGLILDSEGITGSNSYSFMKYGAGSFAIVDEPYSMEPRKGFLGEVRCPTEETAMKASTSCKIAPFLIEYQPEMDVVECTTNMIDPMALFSRGSLPQVREGMTFTQSIEKNSIQAMTTGEIRASVRLTLDDYEVEYKVTNNDCDSTFINITGCYSCDEGARLCVKVKASGDAIFHFTDNDQINVLFKVTTSSEVHCTVLHFSSPVISIEGQYDCGQERKPMLIKGTLVAVAPHDDRVVKGGSSIVVNPKSGGIDFMGWLKGFSSWFGGPLKTALLIIGLLLVGTIVVILIIFLVKFGVRQAFIKKTK